MIPRLYGVPGGRVKIAGTDVRDSERTGKERKPEEQGRFTSEFLLLNGADHGKIKQRSGEQHRYDMQSG